MLDLDELNGVFEFWHDELDALCDDAHVLVGA